MGRAVVNRTNRDAVDNGAVTKGAGTRARDSVLDLVNALIGLVGRPGFADRLLDALNRLLSVDHCVVFTFEEGRGVGHLFTRGRMDAKDSEKLAADYVAGFHAEDPTITRLISQTDAPTAGPVRPDFSSQYGAAYVNRFFSRTQLVDKATTIGRVENGIVYCNFYRMAASGRFSAEDWDLLEVVLPTLTALIARHYEIVRTAKGGEPASDDDGRFAKGLVHAVMRRSVEPFDQLTARERDVCERIILGYSTTAMALDLEISETSVATYRKRAYAKLGISSQNELFLLCLSAAERVRTTVGDPPT